MGSRRTYQFEIFNINVRKGQEISSRRGFGREQWTIRAAGTATIVAVTTATSLGDVAATAHIHIDIMLKYNYIFSQTAQGKYTYKIQL
jgi:hypothetical protein